MIKKIYLFSLGLLAGLPSVASAQGLKNAGSKLSDIGNKAGVKTDQSLGTIVGNIISAALSLVGVVFLGLMVYAGYLWMTAAGDSDQIDQAKKIIRASLIGLVITLSAYAITAFVTSKLGSLG